MLGGKRIIVWDYENTLRKQLTVAHTVEQNVQTHTCEGEL